MARRFLGGIDLLNQLVTAIGAQMSTGKLLGRSTAGSGAIEEISIGSGLSLSAGTLSASQYSSTIVSVTALDIDCSTGNYFIKTINGNSTFTFSNAPASCAYGFTLELTHTSGTVTWPATVKWNKDTAPTLTAGRTHLFMFITDDSGTRWRGAALVDYVN